MAADASETLPTRCLQKILAEKDAKNKQHARLKAACETALDLLAKEPKGRIRAGAGREEALVGAEKLFLPLKLACEAKSTRIVKAGVESFQKLVACGNVHNRMLIELDGIAGPVLLVDAIVDAVRACYTGDQTDEGVQMQVVKTLLTLVASSTSAVHGAALIKAIRTCFSVYLTSKHLINQSTAKSALAQIVSIVFRRLETLPPYQPKIEEAPPTSAATAAAAIAAAAEPAPAPAAAAAAATAPIPASASVPVLAFVEGGLGASGVEVLMPTPTYSSAAMSAASTASVTPAPTPGPEPSPGTAAAPPASVAPIAPAPAPAPAAAAAVPGVPASITAPAATAPALPPATPAHGERPRTALDRAGLDHVYVRDALAVLKVLCSLSQKDLPDKDAIDRASIDLRCKIMCLELQLLVLELSGPVFASYPVCIDLVRQHLCVALSKNGASPVVEVVERSLAAVQLLITKLRPALKLQMEVFFKEILLNIVDMASSSLQHKWMALLTFERICKTPQLLLDLYANYDCDEFMTNIFERMVNSLARVTQSPQPELKFKALECIVAIATGLEEIYKVQEVDTENEEEATLDRGNSKFNDFPLSPQRQPAPPSAAAAAEPKAEGAAESEFETLKQKKIQREQGIELFNKKPTKGIKYMQEAGFVGTEVVDVARFLHSEDRLDRGMIGDYLGEKDDFNIAVMHSYIDQVDFSSIDPNSSTAFLSALRIFLGSFRLPGESQKIDRLMEKFAQRYCQLYPDNGIFASADAAYILAYSIIMLTTDLHNAQVKRKITKDGFINMTRGVNDNKDLPRQFLEDIYDAVAKEEIKLNTIHKSKELKSHSVVGQDGMKTIAETAAIEMDRRKGEHAVFLPATDPELVRPIFKLLWKPLLTALAGALAGPAEPAVVHLALPGLLSLIHISCACNLAAARNSIVKALGALAEVGATLETKGRAIEAVRALLQCATRNGNDLGENWREIMVCVSELEHAQLIDGAAVSGAAKARRGDGPDASLGLVLLVDQIFSRTRSLNREEIVHFVRALCSVSDDEISVNPPRMYSLSKLVYVAHYNLGRIRIELVKMWEAMGPFFNKVGCSNDQSVAFFAIDSLRQLSTKFLDRGEMENYQFQNKFLRPFEIVMDINESIVIRQMILDCVAQLVKAKAANIRSGWKSILQVLTLASIDSTRAIVESAYQTICAIFELFKSGSIRGATYTEAATCMKEFACNGHFSDIAAEAIRRIRDAATSLVESPKMFFAFIEDHHVDVWTHGWLPTLFALSHIVEHGKLDSRALAIGNMFELMRLYGAQFPDARWDDLRGFTFKFFEESFAAGLGSESERVEWQGAVLSHTLRSLVEIVHLYFGKLQSIFLPRLFPLISSCVCSNRPEQLSRTAAECVRLLLTNDGQQFTEASWAQFVTLMRQLFKATLPEELVTFNFKESSDKDKRTDGKPRRERENPRESGGSPPRTGAALSASPPAPMPAPGTAAKEASAAVAGGAGAGAGAGTGAAGPLSAEEERDRREQAESRARIILKCVLHVDLIQTIDFALLVSNKQDPPSSDAHPDPSQERQRSLTRAVILARPLDPPTPMFACINTEHLLALLELLDASHNFAMKFNANTELRVRLGRAGVMRGKTKPTLQRQEMASITAYLRILFRMLGDARHAEARKTVEELLLSACASLLHQFVTDMPRDGRESLAPAVQLALREILALADTDFCVFAAALYVAVSDVMLLGHDAVLGDLVFFLAEFFQRTRRFQL